MKTKNKDLIHFALYCVALGAALGFSVCLFALKFTGHLLY